MAKALPCFLTDASDDHRLLLSLALSLIPYSLSNAVDTTELLGGVRGALPQVDGFLEEQKELFRSWGIE